jgi:NADH dehydrogenase/NADH:ubiquinone oxidoreductase subunit G
MAGDFVPTLCHHPSIKHTEHSATCRLCMVDVTEVKGAGVQRCNPLSAICSVSFVILVVS